MSTQPLVLVADDEPRITKLVSIALGEEGFRVVTAGSGEEALAKAEEVRPDIVLLDIVMPDLDGIEVMRQLRERRPVAVILLTAKGSTADKAKGLDLGADDYIAKPFHPDELAARVRAVLRRSSGAQPGAGVLKFDDVEIDLERRMVTRNGELVQLSRTEWLLLQHLAANAGKVVLHTELLTKVWGPEYRDDLQYLRVWVSRVRRKLGAEPGEPGRIKTFQGIGYLLDVEPPVPPETVAPDRRRRAVRADRVGPGRRRPSGRHCATLGACSAMARDGPDRGRRPERLRRPGRRACAWPAARPSSRPSTARSRWRVNDGRDRRRDPGLAPGVDAALRQGRRHLAGPLRRGHVGRGAPSRTWHSPMTRRGSARAPTARTATRASRCATRSPARRSPTELEGLLRDAGVERVVVVGLATDYCVKATALDAVRLGFETDGPDRRDRARSTSSRATASARSTRCGPPASTLWRGGDAR